MIQQKKRLVLFLPHRANPAQGVRVSADLLPLELLQIAGFPDQEGYEVVLIDSMIHEDYMDRVMEACDGALLFASSCILGYQVTHGAQVASAVRQRFPELPIIWGGWFPSVVPETYINEGIADAVALGQGELTFRDVATLRTGSPSRMITGPRDAGNRSSKIVCVKFALGLMPKPTAPAVVPFTGSSRRCTTAPFFETHTVWSPYTLMTQFSRPPPVCVVKMLKQLSGIVPVPSTSIIQSFVTYRNPPVGDVGSGTKSK